MKNKSVFYSSTGGLYFMGFIGALIYYFQMANIFSEYVFGLIKALFWPAFLVYQSLHVLGA